MAEIWLIAAIVWVGLGVLVVVLLRRVLRALKKERIAWERLVREVEEGDNATS